MKILITGEYQPAYNRNQIILKGLRKHGIDFIEFPYKKRNKKTLEVVVELAKNCDLIFLPSFTHLDVPFLKKEIQKPIIFDPLISKYMTKVFDLKTIWRFSPRAYKNFLKDKRAFKHSDLIIADTKSHKEYYCSHFGVDPDKIIIIPVGVDTEEFFPKEIPSENQGKLIVGFYGTFIPLHGIEKIILAANELRDRQDIHFEIFGKGFLFKKISPLAKRMKLQNIEFKGWVEYQNLNEIINKMDICLGIFGESIKTEFVIPNKIFHYAACCKPIISRDTKAIREIFTNNEDIVLCSNSPESLAQAILTLAEKPELRKKIGEKAYKLMTENYNELKITQPLVDSFIKLSGKNLFLI